MRTRLPVVLRDSKSACALGKRVRNNQQDAAQSRTTGWRCHLPHSASGYSVGLSIFTALEETTSTLAARKAGDMHTPALDDVKQISGGLRELLACSNVMDQRRASEEEGTVLFRRLIQSNPIGSNHRRQENQSTKTSKTKELNQIQSICSIKQSINPFN
jgi:hypothetical protein